MVSRAKEAGASSSLVRYDLDSGTDDVTSTQAEAKPRTRRKARGRPPGIGNRVDKSTPRATRTTGKHIAATCSSSRKHAVSSLSQGLQRSVDAVAHDTGGYDTVKRTRGRPNATGSDKVAASTSFTKRSAAEEIPETQSTAVLRIKHDTADSSAMDELSMAEADISLVVDGPAASDVFSRRRLGELNKRHENLKIRHRDLRDVGIKSAEVNFDRLKKQAEGNIAVSNHLILQLQEDLAAQTALAEQGESLRQQLERSEANAESLQAAVDKLTADLNAARQEISALSVKLTVNRNAENSVQKPTIKFNAVVDKSELIHTAHAKEDLYGDLTGLIVRGLSQGEDEDIFDCIQTGRNGTLHFKLASERRSPSESYDDVQLTYRPQLDESRDQGLIQLLPDYLVEDITFSRSHASKFYHRVIRSLSEGAV
ncbi:hypothetical protein L249_8117 [Ophiocordyceps polyrhachis-furcata BCC 54312]|uniref:Monopolin complex subunit Csm1/Pcs1 C-terminal domain-containing protein n=1 Tax=Ophiocordyceps polyrhachis-furcata BCC 54312 TaxID=1330021 RepID=A0A367LHP2_9HYPO|nr:hypothetical protein L249_8117 [Ophiocordyceps polyrhachis-furcata BCC 54312]